ncbi:Solute carrier 26 [Blyttiomyces sp. JEL0837]|nr:Solute carrier 26 [Blyttiomyces sp. JEL0837]
MRGETTPLLADSAVVSSSNPQSDSNGLSVQDLWGNPEADEPWNPSTASVPSGTKDRSDSMMRTFWTRVRYYIPILSWLPNYSIRENLQGDIVAGATVACLLIPQALSYAQALVKIPPVYGLYTCFVPLIVYSILGTSRQLGVGPEALVSILVGAAIAEKSGLKPIPVVDEHGTLIAPDNIAENIAIANLMGLMVGLFTFLLGFFRLGFLDSVLSRALLRGFVTAVAVVVMIDLSPNLLGIKEQASSAMATFDNPNDESHWSPIEKLLHVLGNIGNSHVPTAVISIISISFLIGMKVLKSHYSQSKYLQMVPEILALVVVSTLLCSVFRWDEMGVDILKDVQGGLIAPKLPQVTLAKVRFYLLSAILISVIGFVESIAVAKTYATKYNYAMSPNRELVALGAANILGSIFGGWPAFGSLGRSAVNDASGAKTPFAGFVTGIIILVTIIVLLPLFYFLPKAVCSSIIVVAASKLIELHDVGFILRLRAWNDMGLLLLTFVTTMVVSIEAGTLISVGTSLLLVIKHTTKTRIAILGRTLVLDPKTGQVKTKFRSISEHNQVERIEGGLVIRIEEGLFFGNVGQLKDRLKRVEMYGELGVHPGEEPRVGIPASASGANLSRTNSSTAVSALPANRESSGLLSSPQGSPAAALKPAPTDGAIHSVIFDIGAVTAVDASATQTLLEIVESYHSRNIIVCFVKLRENCRLWFERAGLYDLVGSEHFFNKISDAIESLRRVDRILAPPSGLPGESSGPSILVDNGSGGDSDEYYGGGFGTSTPAPRPARKMSVPSSFVVGSWGSVNATLDSSGFADTAGPENEWAAQDSGPDETQRGHSSSNKTKRLSRKLHDDSNRIKTVGGSGLLGVPPRVRKLASSGNGGSGSDQSPRLTGNDDVMDLFSDSEMEGDDFMIV